MIEYVVFYDEWLPLPKAEFNVLAMIAEQGGTYAGNLSDMCRYLNVTPQDRNRRPLRAAIESLTSKGFLSCETRGRTYHLKVIPRETEVKLPQLWVQSVIQCPALFRMPLSSRPMKMASRISSISFRVNMIVPPPFG